MKLGRKCYKINGKPGTGKTTALAWKILPVLQGDFEFYKDRVILTSFSRSASTAINKTLSKEGIDVDQVPNIRTIHSLSARTLDLKKREDFVHPEDYEEFCQTNYIPYKSFEPLSLDEIDFYGMIGRKKVYERGNILFEWFQALKRKYIYPRQIEENIPRRTGLSEREVKTLGFSTEWLKEIYHKWEEWKERKGKYEYDDMLQKIVLREEPFPKKIEFGIVDEFQDLSPLQIKVLEIFLREAKEVWVAGDPMQCIYLFNQAEPRLFNDLEVDEEFILEKSYRVPIVPWNIVRTFGHLARDQTIDKVEPTSREGSFVIIGKEQAIELLKTLKESVFALFRTNMEVQTFLDLLTAEKIPVKGLGKTKTAFDDPAFIYRYNLITKLYHEEPLTYPEVRFLIISIPPIYLKRGVKTSFRDRLRKWWCGEEKEEENDTHSLFYNLFPPYVQDVEDIIEILRDSNVRISADKKRYLLNTTPSMKPIDRKLNKFIGTMHSSKGLEANSVIVFDYLENREAKFEDECRLNAVAFSRTRDADYLCLFEGIPELSTRYERGFIERNLL